MGTCAAHLPGTNGIMKGKLVKGSYSDSTLSMSGSFYTTDMKKIVDLVFDVTMSTVLTPAPIDVYVYHA